MESNRFRSQCAELSDTTDDTHDFSKNVEYVNGLEQIQMSKGAVYHLSAFPNQSDYILPFFMQHDFDD